MTGDETHGFSREILGKARKFVLSDSSPCVLDEERGAVYGRWADALRAETCLFSDFDVGGRYHWIPTDIKLALICEKLKLLEAYNVADLVDLRAAYDHLDALIRKAGPDIEVEKSV